MRMHLVLACFAVTLIAATAASEAQSFASNANTDTVFLSGSGQSNTSSPSAPAQAGQSAEELAKKLSNPVASLISLPFQNNFDFNLGPNSDGFRYTMNFQPVIPIKLNEQWNLISRTIIPIIHQSNITAARTSQTGLGDTVQSFSFRQQSLNRLSGELDLHCSFQPGRMTCLVAASLASVQLWSC